MLQRNLLYTARHPLGLAVRNAEILLRCRIGSPATTADRCTTESRRREVVLGYAMRCPLYQAT
jgi:hypothetical protein